MKPTHDELQGQVVDALNAMGWRHLHVRRSVGRGSRWTTTTNVKGWPDLFCWTPRQPGRFVAIEVKVQPDDLRPDQAEVLADLAASGVECYVLWPEDLTTLPRWLHRDSGKPDGITNLGPIRRVESRRAKHPDPERRAPVDRP